MGAVPQIAVHAICRRIAALIQAHCNLVTVKTDLQLKKQNMLQLTSLFLLYRLKYEIISAFIIFADTVHLPLTDFK